MKTEIERNLSPDDLAEVFIHWGSDEQANFLNLIGTHFKQADFDAEGQCCWLAEDVNKNGRDFVYTLANFIKVRGIPDSSPKLDALINHYECDSLR